MYALSMQLSMQVCLGLGLCVSLFLCSFVWLFVLRNVCMCTGKCADVHLLEPPTSQMPNTLAHHHVYRQSGGAR